MGGSISSLLVDGAFEILLVNEERDFLRGAVEFFDDEPDADPVQRTLANPPSTPIIFLQSVWKNQPLENAGLTDPRVSFRLVRAIKDLELRAIHPEQPQRGGADSETR